MKTANFFLFFLFLILLLPSTAMAYSINNLDFGTIKEGETITKDLTVSLTTQDSNSYFKIEKDNDMGSYLKVEPTEFELKAGRRKTLKVTLTTTGLSGEQKGWIIARGQKPLGEGQIGYTVSLKSNIRVNVVDKVINEEVVSEDISNTINKNINEPISTESLVNETTNEDNNYIWIILVIGAIGIVCFVIVRRLYYNGYI